MARSDLEIMTMVELVELFGPDLEGIIREAGDLVASIYGEELRFRDDDQEWAIATWMERAQEAFNEVAERWLKPAYPLLLVEVVGRPLRLLNGAELHSVPIGRAREPMCDVATGQIQPHRSAATEMETEEGKPRYRVTANPGISDWLSVERWQLEDDALRGLDRLRRFLDRLSLFVRMAARLCKEAIRLAMAKLGELSLAEEQGPDTIRTLRDLIGELLSPHILAAGTGAGLFVVRC